MPTLRDKRVVRMLIKSNKLLKDCIKTMKYERQKSTLTSCVNLQKKILNQVLSQKS